MFSLDARTKESLEQLAALCRERGLPLTNQRRTILEELLSRTDHPTADQVYEAVRGRIPPISRRTVYRVLETLVELGLVNRVHHPGAAVRFDAKVQRHHHLVCVRCNRIVDYVSASLDEVVLPRGQPLGFEIKDFSVQLRGTCPDCRAEARTRRTAAQEKNA